MKKAYHFIYLHMYTHFLRVRKGRERAKAYSQLFRLHHHCFLIMSLKRQHFRTYAMCDESFKFRGPFLFAFRVGLKAILEENFLSHMK